MAGQNAIKSKNITLCQVDEVFVAIIVFEARNHHI